MLESEVKDRRKVVWGQYVHLFQSEVVRKEEKEEEDKEEDNSKSLPDIVD